MTMFVSKSKKKRELATVCRMGFEMVGILLALILQGVIIGNKNNKCIHLNSETNLTGINVTSITSSNSTNEKLSAAIFLNDIANEFKTIYQSQKYFLAAGIFMIIFILCMILFFVGAREDLGKTHAHTRTLNSTRIYLYNENKIKIFRISRST